MSQRRREEDFALDSDPLWYKDAIIYEMHVRSFFDSDADGIGDFRGLRLRLDYLLDLGVTAIWLLPFYPSPLKDDGYDIADYTAVHPNYGTLKDFRDFLDAAHRRGGPRAGRAPDGWNETEALRFTLESHAEAHMGRLERLARAHAAPSAAKKPTAARKPGIFERLFGKGHG